MYDTVISYLTPLSNSKRYRPLLSAIANFKLAFSCKGLAIILADSKGFRFSSATTPVITWLCASERVVKKRSRRVLNINSIES